jgi:hypothetical protein
MTRITVDLSALRTILAAAVPFAGGDHSLPVINAVLLEGKGKWLVATTTDRYSLAKSRTLVEGVDGFRALVKLADAKHILKTFTAAKGTGVAASVSLAVEDRTDTNPAKLTIDREEGLFADCDSLTATYLLVDGEFPKTDGLFQKWKPTTDAPGGGFNPELLARFQHVTSSRGEPIRLMIGNDRGVAVVQAGDYFLGAIMPVRLSEPLSDLASWTDVIGQAPEPEAAPVAEPAKPVVKKAAPAKKAAAKKRVPAQAAA